MRPLHALTRDQVAAIYPKGQPAAPARQPKPAKPSRRERRAQFAALKRSGRLTADATWQRVMRTEPTKAELPGGLNLRALARAGITVGPKKASR